ncbi:odorant receptor 30a-like [Armigeres subalbatus]|uniref:odorant receptor 30a-like n=1 Tax=Armigeres subalbatus TaxID=124917 RepID=UPI002ED230AD
MGDPDRRSSPARLTSFDADLKLIHWLGYWGSTDKKNRSRSAILLLLFVFFIIPLLLSLVDLMLKKQYVKASRNAGELVTFCMDLCSITVIIIRKRKFVQALDKFQIIFEKLMEEEDPIPKKMLGKIENLSKNISVLMERIMGSTGFLYCCAPFLYTLFCVNILYSDPVPFPTGIEVNFYYINIQSNVWLYSFYMMVIIPVTWIITISIGVKDTLFINIFNHCTMNFRILMHKINQLKTISDVEVNTHLKNLVDLHSHSFECVGILNDSINVDLLAHYLGSSAILCLNMLVFTEVELNGFMVLRLAIMFMHAAWGITVFAWLGERLALAGSEVAEAIYETEWYDKPIHVQKALMMMLQRGQTNPGVMVGKFFESNNEGLKRATNAVYSFFLFIKHVYGRIDG